MTDKTRADFEVWLDEPHPADASMTRRDYMPKNDGGFAAMVWQAATLAAQGKRQPLTLRQISEATPHLAHIRSDYVIYVAQAIEAAHKITATPQGKL